jgi:hypothetical protein
MPAKPSTCPTCGGPKCWEQGTSAGYMHKSGCEVLAMGIPVRMQVGDGELTEIGQFMPEGDETVPEALITFLHATAMLMLSRTGRNPAANCMEPAMKVARANN